MVDIRKHIEYWRLGAEDALDSAERLIEQGKIRHGLFFAHLALEKLLKAHVCKTTGDMAPYVHNLVKLAEKAELNISDDQSKTLVRINDFNIEGRYPELLKRQPSRKVGMHYFEDAKRIYEWLMHQL